MSKTSINIGLIGAGTVGSGLIQILSESTKTIFDKTGLEINLKLVCDKNTSKLKPTNFEVVNDYKKITENPQIDLVVELVGGTGIAFEIIKSALENSKYVVTANKALLSEKGDELFTLARTKNVEIGFEASVAGAIPIIRSIKTGFASNRFDSLYGILNGTTNFILTKMEEENMDYLDALKLAQNLGFAELDPSFDVEGIDAAHKLSLLASIAFTQKVPIQNITIEGITKITKSEIQLAKSLGLRIKLLAICKRIGEELELRVSPVMLPISHPIASVKNEMNAVYVETSYSGSALFMGKGAGSLPTASAVLSDIIHYGSKSLNQNSNFEKNLFQTGKVANSLDSNSRFYIRIKTIDKPGVLGEITSILGKHSISISSMRQNESTEGEIVDLIILTHYSKLKNIEESLNEIDHLSPIVKEKSIRLRLEDLS